MKCKCNKTLKLTKTLLANKIYFLLDFKGNKIVIRSKNIEINKRIKPIQHKSIVNNDIDASPY